MCIVNNRREHFGLNICSIFTSRDIAECKEIVKELFSCEVVNGDLKYLGWNITLK